MNVATHYTGTSNDVCFDEARMPPGRQGLPVLGETLAFLRDTGGFVRKRVSEHGRVFRTHLFGKPTVVVAGAEANRFVLRDGLQRMSWRDGWPPTFHALFGSVLMLQDGDEHRRKRRLLMPAFRTEALHHYMRIVEEHLPAYLDRWERLGRFAWYPELRKLIFEVTSALFLGYSLGPESDELTRLMGTWIGGLFALPFRVPGSAYSRALRVRPALLSYVERAIEHRMRNPSKDALGLIIESRDEHGARMSMEEIESQALFLVAVGQDTTASLVTSLVRCLAEYPEVLARARQEQQALGVDGPPTLADLQRMTYLEQVMLEVERMHPPAGFGFRGVVEPFVFAEYRFPAGWQVLYSIEATHYDPAVYPEPARFDPERFRDPARVEAERRKRFELVGFGGGPRICMGMGLAKMQAKLIAARLLRGYAWELEAGQDLRARVFPSRCPRSGLRVRFRRLDRGPRGRCRPALTRPRGS